MYKALLWKEWKETRLFLLIMASGVPCFSILLNILENKSDIKADANLVVYCLLLVFYSVLLGSVQFAGEKESGTTEFIQSRPIHWFNIWLFKVVYGSASLILFILFLFVMGNIFISPFLGSGTLIQEFLTLIPDFTVFTDLNKILFLIVPFTLYFFSCTVSTNIKSTLITVIVTYITALFLLLLLDCSFTSIYLSASLYIFLSILPILFFIIFVKHRQTNCFTKIACWTLPVGTVYLWIFKFFSGGRLSPRLLTNDIPFGRYFINTDNIYFAYLIPAGFVAAVVTSIFSSGIFRREYRFWWKSLSCLNFFIITSFCFIAILTSITPGVSSIDFGNNTNPSNPALKFHDEHRVIDNSGSTFIIAKSLGSKSEPSLKNKSMLTSARISEKHFLLNDEKGKVTFFGREKFMRKKPLMVSPDQRWVIYACPKLNWKLYHTSGLWAENLETSEQYFLMDLIMVSIRRSHWLDKGKRFILFDKQNARNNLYLFSVENNSPGLIKKVQIPHEYSFHHIDDMGKMYFYNFFSNIITCYNRDLEKEYDTTAIQDKVNKLKSEFKGKNVEVNSSQPVISPDGKYMLFDTYAPNYSKAGEGRQQSWRVSLPDGEYKKIGSFNFSGYTDSWRNIPWHPVAKNLWFHRKTEQGDRGFGLFDIESGTDKSLITIKRQFRNANEPYYFMCDFAWSGDGKYFLIYETSNHTDMTNIKVKLYSFDLETRTSAFVSTKNGLRKKSQLWSKARSHVVFQSKAGNELWILDLTRGKWTMISPPFKDYTILGINNSGEVFAVPKGKVQIYRLTQNKPEIIYQEK